MSIWFWLVNEPGNGGYFKLANLHNALERSDPIERILLFIFKYLPSPHPTSAKNEINIINI